MLARAVGGPDLTADERRELYLLRRHFGIGAHEAEHELPLWERQLLLDELVASWQRGEQQITTADMRALLAQVLRAL